MSYKIVDTAKNQHFPFSSISLFAFKCCRRHLVGLASDRSLWPKLAGVVEPVYNRLELMVPALLPLCMIPIVLKMT